MAGRLRTELTSEVQFWGRLLTIRESSVPENLAGNPRLY
jgi:hypothetical protein